MKKLFDKDPILFALLWIAIYVVGFSTADSISEKMGHPQLITVALGLVLAVYLYGFLRQNDIQNYFGLCKPVSQTRSILLYLPLVPISSVNLWFGLELSVPVAEAVTRVVCMCLVGFLEELIFRGFLFKGMYPSNAKTAIVVSSVTFGIGHIVNLLSGAPLLDTLLQLVYACAGGFCYTALFLACGSLLPCILSHAVLNSLSVFAVQPAQLGSVLTSVFLTLATTAYGLWLLKKVPIPAKK